MLRYAVVVLLLVLAASISEGLEVGDSVLRTPITSGDREINFADFHGKSNLIVLCDFPGNPEFVSQVQQKSGTLQEKYDATVLRLQEEGETLIVDKSGYVRWKFPNAADSAQPVIEQFESELAKLKRDEPLPIGAPAPDFRLVDVETGLFFHLAKYKGKKHILATLLLQTY